MLNAQSRTLDSLRTTVLGSAAAPLWAVAICAFVSGGCAQLAAGTAGVKGATDSAKASKEAADGAKDAAGELAGSKKKNGAGGAEDEKGEGEDDDRLHAKEAMINAPVD